MGRTTSTTPITRTTAAATAVALALVLLSGCAGGGDGGSSASADKAVGSAPPSVGGGATGGAGPTDGRTGAAARLVTDQRVVRDATMTVRTGDVVAASVRVRDAAETAKGFVADEKTTTSPRDPRAPEPQPAQGSSESVLTLRVPNEALDRVMGQVAGTGTLLTRTQSSQDVTQTYVDVRSRVASQTASVERVRALLARASTIGQIVQVEGELAKREADLESMKAQLASLEDRTQLSTLTVTLTSSAAPAPAARRSGFLTGLAAGWTALLASLTALLTVIGALLPFAVLAALVAAAAWSWARRSRRARDSGSGSGTGTGTGTGADAGTPSPAQPQPTS